MSAQTVQPIDLLVVGGGVAGLSCAAEAQRLGARVVVLERSAGVGGRCATRRVAGQPVDHGAAFLHGSDTEFVETARVIPGATRLDGWPHRVEGDGTPCQPRAFAPFEHRWTYAEGVNVFPKWLARAVDVRRNVTVRSLRESNGRIATGTDGAGSLEAPVVVLALAIPQLRPLLATFAEDSPGLESARYLASILGTHPCLTVLATYPSDTPEPPWDVLYPGDSLEVHLIVHDSAKREAPSVRVLVIQALPCWSAAHLDRAAESWASTLLAEAGRLVGPWASQPSEMQAHRWRYARADRGMELARPLVIRLKSGARLGLAGEVFSPGAGVEAAWLSGRRAARRLFGTEAS